MKNLKLRALLHAFGVVAYVAIISLFFQFGEDIFGRMNNFFGPIAFLLLFILSATITSSLVLGKPILLYLENRKAEALKLFFYTVAWLFVIMILIFGLQIIFR